MHAAVNNHGSTQRDAIFLGYSYRWLVARDEMTVSHFLPSCGPIRRQLLGALPTGGMGATSPQEVDTPLRSWLEGHGIDLELDVPGGSGALLQVAPSDYVPQRGCKL